MKRTILIFVFVCIIKIGFSQNFKIDTLKLIYGAKLQTIESEGAFFNSEELADYLDNELSTRFLKSKGFQNVSFILIEQRNNLTDTSKHSDKTYKNNTVFWNCDYVVAYNYSTKLYYKLKGFRNNDFVEFIHHLRMNSSVPIPEYTIIDKDIFLSFYNIEDIDLECLWEYNFGKRKKNKEYPCVNSCVERDLLIEDPF